MIYLKRLFIDSNRLEKKVDLGPHSYSPIVIYETVLSSPVYVTCGRNVLGNDDIKRESFHIREKAKIR